MVLIFSSGCFFLNAALAVFALSVFDTINESSTLPFFLLDVYIMYFAILLYFLFSIFNAFIVVEGRIFSPALLRLSQSG